MDEAYSKLSWVWLKKVKMDWNMVYKTVRLNAFSFFPRKKATLFKYKIIQNTKYGEINYIK